jgi:hypothetical protein
MTGAPVLAEALVRWQHAAGPFWPYVCAAPFLGTGDSMELLDDLESDRARQCHIRTCTPPVARWTKEQRKLAATLLDGLPHGAGGLGAAGAEACREAPDGLPLLLADLPPEPLLAIAPLLADQGWYVVPVIQRWIARPAVLPCRTLLQRLLDRAWRLHRPGTPRGVVLLADGARLGPRGYQQRPRGRAFDNRYEYQICRFPSTAFLQAGGVRQVRWLTARGPGPTASLRDLEGRPVGAVVTADLAPYQEALLQAGINVDVQTWPLAR